MSRPEYQGAPEVYYDGPRAATYSRNSRIIEIQSRITSRALELLCLPPPEEKGGSLILDVGCGSGVSGQVVTDAGHTWIGCDISRDMLDVAVDREIEGDLLLADIGCPLCFRPGTIDGTISISAVQWLCNADRSEAQPFRRALCFFRWLYNSLSRGARAALQFYPDSVHQVELLTSAAIRAGFGGGMVVDYPNSAKAKKHFLVIWAGFSGVPPSLPKAMDGQELEHVAVVGRDRKRKGRGKKVAKKSREWVLKKKVQQEKSGKEVRITTKYTARKRRDGV